MSGIQQKLNINSTLHAAKSQQSKGTGCSTMVASLLKN